MARAPHGVIDEAIELLFEASGMPSRHAGVKTRLSQLLPQVRPKHAEFIRNAFDDVVAAGTAKAAVNEIRGKIELWQDEEFPLERGFHPKKRLKYRF